MAATALRSAMIQVVGERDIGSQETAHLLLGKPLYSSTFACVSLDGSRRVRTGQDENDNQGDEALDPSVLDTLLFELTGKNRPQIFLISTWFNLLQLTMSRKESSNVVNKK